MVKRKLLLVATFTNLIVFGSDQISQNKQREYKKGQGLTFDLSSDPEKRKIEAEELIKSLDRQNCSLDDVLKDHLNQIENHTKKVINGLIGELRFFDNIQPIINNKLRMIESNMSLQEKNVTFEGTYSEDFKEFVKTALNKYDVSYPITVKIDQNNNPEQFMAARVNTKINSVKTWENKENLNINFSLFLSLSIWGNGQNIIGHAIMNPSSGLSILSHESQHIKKLHGVKLFLLDDHLKKLSYDKEVRVKVQEAYCRFVEHEADILSFIDEKSRLDAFYGFKEHVEFKNERGYEYLQLNELSKIISLYEAKERIMQQKEMMEKTERIFISYGAANILNSPLLPVKMKISLLDKIQKKHTDK